MLTFLLYTLLFSMAGMCWVRVMTILIQPMQLLDMIFGWQKMLNRLANSPVKRNQGLAKILGDCEVCWSHFLTFIWFFVYTFIMNVVIHHWITDFITAHGILWWILALITDFIWYIVFCSMGTIFSLWALVKFKIKQRKDANL